MRQVETTQQEDVNNVLGNGRGERKKEKVHLNNIVSIL